MFCERLLPQYKASNLDLINEGKRWRDPVLGLFLTPDPLEYVDGPNMYIYCGQNPWGNFDPLGLWTFGIRLNVNLYLITLTVGLHIDGHGDCKLLGSAGAGVGLSVSVGATATNAETVDMLEGGSVQVGGSPILGAGLEGAIVTGSKDAPYVGIDVGVGVGAEMPIKGEYSYSVDLLAKPESEDKRNSNELISKNEGDENSKKISNNPNKVNSESNNDNKLQSNKDTGNKEKNLVKRPELNNNNQIKKIEANTGDARRDVPNHDEQKS